MRLPGGSNFSTLYLCSLRPVLSGLGKAPSAPCSCCALVFSGAASLFAVWADPGPCTFFEVSSTPPGAALFAWRYCIRVRTVSNAQGYRLLGLLRAQQPRLSHYLQLHVGEHAGLDLQHRALAGEAERLAGAGQFHLFRDIVVPVGALARWVGHAHAQHLGGGARGVQARVAADAFLGLVVVVGTHDAHAEAFHSLGHQRQVAGVEADNDAAVRDRLEYGQARGEALDEYR